MFTASSNRKMLGADGRWVVCLLVFLGVCSSDDAVLMVVLLSNRRVSRSFLSDFTPCTLSFAVPFFYFFFCSCFFISIYLYYSFACSFVRLLFIYFTFIRFFFFFLCRSEGDL